MHSGFRAHVLVLKWNSREGVSRLALIYREYSLFTTVQSSNRRGGYIPLLEKGGHLFSTSEVPIITLGAFAREMGILLQRNNLGFSEGCQTKPSVITVDIVLEKGPNV